MNLRVRVMALIGFFLALLLAIGSWGVWSTMSLQDRVLERHESVSDAEMAVLMAQVCFQKQEEEWKNVLLRGHEEAVLEEHWAKFEENEALARSTIEGLRDMLPKESVTGGLAGKFLRDHEALGGLYREALVVFRVGGEGAQARGDGLVQGRAEGVSRVLKEAGEVLSENRDLMEASVHEITIRRLIATLTAILITALFAFVVLALALNHWMDLSILSAGRNVRRSLWNRILVVQHNPERRKELVAELKPWGGEVLAVGSASEAARILELDSQGAGGGHADLVLIGGDMIGIGGFALARWLRAEASTCDIPLIIRGGGRLPGGSAPGGDIEKVSESVSGEKLRRVIARLLERSRRAGKREPVALDYSAEYSRAHRERILVAEDDPMNRKYLALMLERVGLDFELVENGQEAVEAFAEKKCGVVLMDCSMPVMDGYEATRRIREREGAVQSSVIVGVTAHADKESHMECRAAGMDACVSKPLKLEYLCIVIEEELAKRGVGA